MHWIKLVLGITAFGYTLVQSNFALADCKVLSGNTSTYQNLMPYVVKWRDALLSKSSKTLAGYALPDQQKYVLVDLKNKKSNLYRYLYEGKDSIYKLLKNAKKLRIVLVECIKEGYAEFGPRIEVYYYDEKEINLQFPLSSMKYEHLSRKYLEWSKKGYIFVHQWGKEEGKWYTNYNILPEDASNKKSKSKD
jgi:hypothetical protein